MANRSIVITGAARGVGAACARRFAQAGDKLTLADVDEEAGKLFTADLASSGADVTFVHADVSNRLHVHNIIAEALDAYGRIDALAHTVMEHFSAAFLETTEEDFDRIVAANIRGAFLINQAVAKHFVKRGENEERSASPGVIVNIGSDEAITVAADHVAFATSQGGLHQLTKAVAIAMSPYNVRVNAVAVGAIKGEMAEDAKREVERDATPLKRIGDPEEVAEVVYFLSSDGASYVTGQCIFVDGGRLATSASSRGDKED